MDASPTVTPPQLPSPPPPPPIAHDLLCIQCQYNLRTRSAADLCPECGLPVFKSIAHHRMHARAIEKPRLLVFAARLFGVIWLLDVVVFAGYYGLDTYARSATAPRWVQLAPNLFSYFMHTLFVAALLAGMGLLARSVSNLVISEAKRSSLSVLSVLYGVLTVVGVLLMTGMFVNGLAMGGGRRFRTILMMYWFLRVSRLASAIVFLLMTIGGFAVMRRLSNVLGSPELSRYTKAAFAAQIVDALIGVIVFAWMVTWRLPFAGNYDMLILALNLFSTVIAVCFGYYWIIVARTVRSRTLAAGVVIPSGEAAASAPEKVEKFLTHRSPGKNDF